MSLRNVTLTAVAALSLGMAAHAQTRTITVPLTEPGATAAPAPTAPGTTVTLNPDGTRTVDTVGSTTGAPATQATPETPAPAAGPTESATDAETGTAATGIDPTTPQPTGQPGEPPAAPQEGLPDAATAEQTAPAADAAADTAAEPAATDAETPVEAEAPAAPLATEAEVPADAEAPAEVGAPGPDAEAAPVEAPTESLAPASGEGEAAPADAAPADAAADAAAPAAETEAEAEVAPEVEAPPASEVAPEAQVTPDAEPEPGEDIAVTGTASEGGAPAQEEAHAETPGASHEQHIEDVSFSFEGPFGRYDQFQLQRGLQVYTEVCAACHGLKQVALRTLADEGGPQLPEDQVRAYAAAMSITDAETGEDRERTLTDHFPTVAGEGMGPDLSLMAKARAGFHGPYGTGLSQLFNGMGGPEYIVSVLTGYTGEEREEAGAVLYENTAFPGGWISMPPPISDDQVTFEDGAPADAHSASMDLAAFLMWAAEPKMMDRKQAGLVSVLFLIVLTVLLYLTNKRLWWPVKYRRDVPGDGM